MTSTLFSARIGLAASAVAAGAGLARVSVTRVSAPVSVSMQSGGGTTATSRAFGFALSSPWSSRAASIFFSVAYLSEYSLTIGARIESSAV